MSRLSRKQVLYAEREFVFQWADRWCQLFNLIYDVLRTDKSPVLPSLPTEHDEIRYQDLRSWLIDNEETFLELWKDYSTSRDWTLDTSNDLIEEIRDAEKVLENPFLWFYGSEDLNIFLKEYVVGKKSGEPNEEHAWAIAMSLLRVDVLAANFVLWIRDGGGDNEGISNEYG